MTKNLSSVKKLMYGALFLAAVGIGVVGCRKENLQKQMVQDVNSSSEFNITSDGRMLIFESIDDYKKVVNDPSDESKAKFLKEVANLKHTTYAELLSLKKSESDDLLGDDDLAQILNEDWIVQIGDYLYRVNKPTESVYVLPASNVDQYEDLVNENKSNKNIRKFSTEDDVIELAENGAEGQKGLFCGEGGVGSRSATINHGSAPNTNSGVTSTLRHSKFGIYFTIVMESYSNWALSQFKFEFPTSSDQRRFKRRCETVEYVPYSGTNQWQSLMSVTEAKYKIRENVSNFSKYHIRARCHYYHNDLFMSQADLVSTSAWLEIRINY